MLGWDRKKQEDYRNHTLLAPSARVVGDIDFSGGLHVLGRVEGNISVTGDGGRLVIGESGSVLGDINVPRVVVNGRVEGHVQATEHLELADKAVVEGNVYYTVLEMVAGAQVNGKLVRQSEGRRNLPSPEAINGNGNGNGGQQSGDTGATTDAADGREEERGGAG